MVFLFFLWFMYVCMSCAADVYLMKINKTMTTYNQHGTFNWFEVDGETYILFKVGSNSTLLNQHYENVTEQQSEIYGLLGAIP